MTLTEAKRRADNNARTYEIPFSVWEVKWNMLKPTLLILPDESGMPGEAAVLRHSSAGPIRAWG